MQKTFFFVLLISFIFSPNMVTAGNLKIESDIKGKANVYIRPSGTNQKYDKISEQVPCEINFPSKSNQDIKIEREENFIFSVSGTAQNIPSNKMFPIKIMTEKRVSWVKILISALVILPFIFFALLRKKAVSVELPIKAEDNLSTESIKDYMIGKQLGRYLITEKIGYGGMASIYLGTDEFGVKYAIKVPDEKYRDDDLFSKRFAHEAIIVSKLLHKSIVRVFDYSLDSRTILFICMEYIEGETLSEILKKEPLQTPQTVLKYMIDILNALKYAHNLNIFHRDIKPSNIMVSKTGDIKLMDFGIAKASDLSVLTATDTMLGTPLYIAPEQIDGKSVDGRADLYSVGTIFYEMLAGKPPFQDPDPIKVIMMKHTQVPLKPSSYNSKITPDYENVIMKLIEKEPENRYASCEEALEDINKL